MGARGRKSLSGKVNERYLLDSSWCENASDFLPPCLMAAAEESRLYDATIHWQPNESYSAKLFT